MPIKCTLGWLVGLLIRTYYYNYYVIITGSIYIIFSIYFIYEYSYNLEYLLPEMTGTVPVTVKGIPDKRKGEREEETENKPISLFQFVCPMRDFN